MYFGREAICIVHEHFRTEKLKNYPKHILSYVWWAVWGDSLAIFKTPTLIDCVVPKKSPDYIVSFLFTSSWSSLHKTLLQKPNGIVCSIFVIALFAPCAKWCKGSGKLKGVLAMSAAGVCYLFKTCPCLIAYYFSQLVYTCSTWKNFLSAIKSNLLKFGHDL